MTGLVSDSNSPIADPQALVDAGYEGCMRYLRLVSMPSILTIGEANRIWEKGLKIGLNHESVADAWRGGAEAGKRAGHTSNVQADALGFPQTVPIYYSPVDQGGGSIDLVRDYLIAAKAEGPRPAALYWGVPMIEQLLTEGVISYGWIAGALAWSAPAAYIQGRRWVLPPENYGRSSLFQTTQQPTIGGTTIDVNLVLQPDWGGWHPNDQPEETMPRQFLAVDPAEEGGTGEVALFTEGSAERVWVRRNDDVHGLIAIGVPWVGANRSLFYITGQKQGTGPMNDVQPALPIPG